MSRIVVAGGAGFIGSGVTTRLLKRGDQVLVVDNFVTGSRENLVSSSNLQLVQASIAETSILTELFEDFRPEIIIHAAGSYKDAEAWEEDVRTNCMGTINLIRAGRLVKVRRVLYFQTALCYGIRPRQRPITLDHPLMPHSSYAVSKVGGERYLELSEIDFVSFRITNAYGPRAVAGPLAAFIRALMTGKCCYIADTQRDFVYIDDLLELVMKAVDGVGVRGCYNVGTGKEYAMKDLFALTAKAMGNQVPLPSVVSPSDEDVRSNLLDTSRTQEIFDWQAVTPLEVGVRRTVEYHQKYGPPETYSHLRPIV